MIKVQFKKEKKNEYNTEEFTYADYINAAVGDVVVVNTRYGYAIAKVSQINIIDERFSGGKLATIAAVLENYEYRKKKEEEKAEKERIVKMAKKKKIINDLSAYITESKLLCFEYEELIEIYNEVFKNK